MIKKTFLAFAGVMIAMYMTGCSSAKIVIPSYTPPKEYKKLSEIESGGDVSDGTYLAMAINPDIGGTAGSDKAAIDAALISSIKAQLTETNFITIYPIFDLADVALNMTIIGYEYNQVAPGSIAADLQVTFTITKGATEYLTKTYGARKRRHSSNAALLPSKSEILVELGQDVTKKFTSDITPRKTNQLREFKSMPSDLEYITTYAKRGNFETAIKDMENYQGNKDAAFYYNLAVLYEAFGSKTESMAAFGKTEEAYNQSMKLGGHSDDMIVNAKARFDNFYRLFKMTQKQKSQNENLNNELGDMFGGME